MKTTTTPFFRSILVFCLALWSGVVLACSPCGALSNVTSTVNGSNLELTFTSNAGWDCCYTVQIEIVCANASFTGIANYQSAQICFNGGTQPSTTNTIAMPYPLTVIDLSNFCPGSYKWRASETGCGIYTSEFTFDVAGASPISLTPSSSQDTICVNDNAQLDVAASGGCNMTGYNYSWTPSVGLSASNVANPVASPTSTTTYTCTVSESGSCTAPQTTDITIVVNPLPTATVSGSTTVCQGDAPPDVVFTGADATSPYSINYTLNGTPFNTVTTGNTATVSVPTGTPGTYTYTIVDVTEASSTFCSQAQNGSAVVVVNPLPDVDAGPDQELCEPNPTSPSEITLNGSGAVNYSWDNGVTDGIPFVPPVGTTVYTVTGTDANGCSNTDFVTITSYPLPTAEGAADLIFGNVPIQVNFSNVSANATEYFWDFGDGSTLMTFDPSLVSHLFDEPGIYTVTLTASNGICYDVWTIQIEVLPPMEVIPPNIFTPNGDGINDEYIVDVRYGAEYEALVVNRWGNEITTFTHLDQGWNGKSNGKDVNEGVYIIRYKATDYSGNVIEGHAPFTIVR